MKTLYSSTFLTAVLAFLALLGQSGTPVTVVQNAPTPAFQTIIEPIGPSLMPAEHEKVTLEIFNTFGCSSCDLFGQGILPQLVDKYEDSDEVELRLYMIPNLESEGELYATRGAHCAAKHERFWDMNYEMHRADVLNKREVDITGQGLHLPVLEFRSCISSEEFDQRIGEDIAYAQAKKIDQKPTVLVNDTLLLGPQPIENIDLIIDKYLNR